MSSTISLEPTKGPQGGSAGIAAIVFSNRAPLCADLDAGKVPGGLQFFVVQLSDNYRSAPTASGTYQVTTGYGGPPKAAVIVAGVDDAQCQSVPSSVALGVSGTVELTRIDNGAYAITFDVVMQTRSGATDRVPAAGELQLARDRYWPLRPALWEASMPGRSMMSGCIVLVSVVSVGCSTTRRIAERPLSQSALAELDKMVGDGTATVVHEQAPGEGPSRRLEERASNLKVGRETTEWLATSVSDSEPADVSSQAAPQKKAVPTAALREISVTDRTGPALRVGLAGGAVGAAVGALFGMALGSLSCAIESRDCSGKTSGAITGALVGFIIVGLPAAAIGSASGHRTTIEFVDVAPTAPVAGQ